MADKKTRWYTVQRNYDFETHDADKNVISDITESEWTDEVRKYMHELYEEGKVKQYALIFHDKDKIETGFKPIHVHMIVELASPTRKSAAITLLKGSSERNVDYVDDKGARGGASRYLLHITEKAIRSDKHIYGEDEVIAEGGFDIHKMMKGASKAGGALSFTEVDKVALGIALAIERDGMTLSDAHDKIFSSFEDELVAQKVWLDWQTRLERSDDNYKMSLAKKLGAGRELLTIYISGNGGQGKSTMAKKLAFALGDNEVPYKAAVGGKGKTFDFADNYGREKVTILDDVSASNFELEEFLQAFDPYQYNPVSSRNKNKVWLSTVAIFTTSGDIETFVEDIMQYSSGGSQFQIGAENAKLAEGERDMARHDLLAPNSVLNATEYTKDKFYQAMRRFEYRLHIENNQVVLGKFNDTHDAPDFDTIGTYPWSPFDIGGDETGLDNTIAKIVEQMAK